LRPAGLAPDVTAESGYDHRGQCCLFEHKQLRELGRIVLIQFREQKMPMQAELYQGQAGIPNGEKEKGNIRASGGNRQCRL